ncbi:MAG: ATP-binding protein [Christensenellaceae bacterium]|jgi:predicted AAA+ superfamily ATPase|nr:ATP-binding protein [Christensenellaceae bacterium]
MLDHKMREYQIKVVDRDVYTERIKLFVDMPLVKIITGLRRSGKSCVMRLVMQEIAIHALADHIIWINFEDLKNQWITSYVQFNEYVLSCIKDDEKYYFFIDEPQLVYGCEKTVNGLRLKNIDIYVAGSTDKLLDCEFATLLAGRYVSFRVLPLSFREFINFRDAFNIRIGDERCELDMYIDVGGFPYLATVEFNPYVSRNILEDINSSIVLKDIIQRTNTNNDPLLKSLLAFVCINIGRHVSIKTIGDFLKGEKLSVDQNAIVKHIGYLVDACIIYIAPKLDINKKCNTNGEKYYLGEHSLLYASYGFREENKAKILENIVYLELLRRKYTVSTGVLRITNRNKTGKEKNVTLEVDFVAEKDRSYVYVQVCNDFRYYSMIKEQKFTPLLEIKNHYRKYVVTLGNSWQADENGVKGIPLKDFLLRHEL